MSKKKKCIRKFAEWLIANNPVPRVPYIRIVWNYPAIATEGGVGFGVFVADDPVRKRIYVAGKWRKAMVMETFAHEWRHCMQYYALAPVGFTADDDIEQDAEAWALEKVCEYKQVVRERKKRRVYK